MGSKGSQTNTNTNQSQTYTADPRVGAAGTQALNMAQGAASQPFQMPVAPVAGFSQDQQGAFQRYRDMQGSFNPYAQEAAQAYRQSAAPITAGDINQYYNPMVDKITGQMQNIFGQQNIQNTGTLSQSAGGVGADRISVGQANMANQQGLAAGQTYAGLYQNALQAAQQQKQMQAGAGAGFLNTGTALNQANLANTNAYLQSGQLQQQQNQAELNAPYQNQLARIAYPFQTAQYLAGITGGLAPTFGGTTTGNQYGVTTPPQPSWLSQAAGIGTAGAGLYGAFNGGFGSNNIYSPSNLADPGNGLNNISDSQAAQYENLYGNRGGATPFADGGDVSPSRGDPEEPRQIAVQTLAPPDIHPLIGGAVARHGMAHVPQVHHDMLETGADTIYNRRGLHRADGGGTDDADVSFPGISKSETADLTPIPLSPMHVSGAGGHSGPLTGAMSFPSPQQQQGKSDSVLGDIAGIAGAAAKIAPLFMLARGGVASYGSGGGDDSFYSPDETGPSPLVDWASNTPVANWLADNKKKFDETPPPAGRVSAPTAGPSFADRFGAAFRGNGANAVAPTPTAAAPLPAEGPGIYQRAHDYWFGPAAAKPAPTTVAEANPSPVAPGSVPLPRAFPGGPSREQVANAYRMPGNVKAEPAAEAEETFVVPKSRDSSPAQIQRAMMPTSQQPYPDALDRDWGQQAARSPWMALVTAGAKMASTPGPLGVSIGQGLQAGVGTLDNQRKELTTEQGLNQKAQALYQTAKAELDKYSKMTPYEQGSLMLRNKEADQSGATGGNGFKSYIQARRLAESEIHKRAQNDPVYTMQHDTAKEIEALTQQIMQHAGGGAGVAAATAAPSDGASATTAMADPGPGLRKKGMWYIGPTGQPQQRLVDG